MPLQLGPTMRMPASAAMRASSRLAFGAAGIEAFGIARRADDRRVQSGARAVAHRLHRGLGGDGQEGDVHRFRHRREIGEARNAVHLLQAAADAVDAAGEARLSRMLFSTM